MTDEDKDLRTYHLGVVKEKDMAVAAACEKDIGDTDFVMPVEPTPEQIDAFNRAGAESRVCSVCQTIMVFQKQSYEHGFHDGRLSVFAELQESKQSVGRKRKKGSNLILPPGFN